MFPIRAAVVTESAPFTRIREFKVLRIACILLTGIFACAHLYRAHSEIDSGVQLPVTVANYKYKKELLPDGQC